MFRWWTCSRPASLGVLLCLGLALLSMALPQIGHAVSERQWFIGAGGGASLLEPDNDEDAGTGERLPSLDVEQKQGAAVSVYFGRDLDTRTSVQLQLYDLGIAEFANGSDVIYRAADASVLYRFYDSQDRRLSTGGSHVALYGRFGLGVLNRDSDEPLENDAGVYFGAGAGIEWLFNRHLGVRAEGFFHDVDAGSAQLSLVTRFGGIQTGTARIPTPVASATAAPPTPAPLPVPVPVPIPAPAPAPVPDTANTPAENAAPVEPVKSPSLLAETPDTLAFEDTDADGVTDVLDVCPDSAAGYPVRDNGCALLDGVLSGIQFVDGGGELLNTSFAQLNVLVSLLRQYPAARIELHAHTDSRGSEAEQGTITRARLRSMGTYLVSQGISARRLVLRSFGATEPVDDDVSAAGRAANNRVEIVEHRP